GEIAYMAEKRRDALHYMFTHPAREVRLFAGRFIMFWTAGTAHPIDDLLSRRSFWFTYVLLFNIFAALAGATAIVALFRRGSIYAIPLAAGPLLFPFAYYLTLALPRYKHPIDPTLLLLSAVALTRGYPDGLSASSATSLFIQ
ncbi:MAG: hypothetical protein M3N93_13550, partial [Acidobacteriota bacterium]|nr:hypothetical protein [Acidobacteriota bacterium]